MFESFQPDALQLPFEAYDAPERHEELDRECRAQVVEWRWATDDMAFAFRRPFPKEWGGHGPEWLKAGAKLKPGMLRHGLDAQGIIHVVEDPWFDNKRAPGRIKPTYLVYQEDQIEAVRYGWSHADPDRVEHLHRRAYDSDQLAREYFLMPGRGGSERQLHWQDDRLERALSIGWTQRRQRDGTWGELRVTSRTEMRFEYDRLGRLARIVERSLSEDGTFLRELGERVQYERPKKKESIAGLAGEIEEMLLEQVPETVASARGRGPFYCLLLCYCEEDFPAGWPPPLILGSEAERRRIVERGEEIGYYLWAPAEMESRTTNAVVGLDDTVLNNVCRRHSQLMAGKRSFASGKKLLRAVCKSLNRLDWSEIIEVTPDFVVAPVDTTGEVDPARDIRAVVPRATLQGLRRQGLI